MKTSRILTISAIVASAALSGCKKAPFQVLDDVVDRIDDQIEAGKSPFANPVFAVEDIDYEEALNTVKIEVAPGCNVGADVVKNNVMSLAPELAQAVKAANAKVLVEFEVHGGPDREVMFEN